MDSDPAPARRLRLWRAAVAAGLLGLTVLMGPAGCADTGSGPAHAPGAAASGGAPSASTSSGGRALVRLAAAATEVGPVTALAFATDSRTLVVGGRAGVQVGVVGDAGALALQAWHEAPVTESTSVAFTGIGRQVVMVSAGTLRLAPDADPLINKDDSLGRALPPLHAVAPLAGAAWAVTTVDGNLITWSSAAGAAPATLARGLGPEAELAASPDRRTLYAAVPGGIGVWRTSGGTLLREATVPMGGPVTGLSVTGPVAVVVAAGSAAVWRLEPAASPDPLAVVPGQVDAAAISPDGTLLVTAAGNRVQVWRVSGFLASAGQ